MSLKEYHLNIVLSLETALKKACSSSQWLWFSDKLTSIHASDNLLQALQIALAMAKRKVGHAPLGSERLRNEPLADPSVAHWQTDEAARVLLILAAMKSPAFKKLSLSDKELVTRLYQQGDEYEKEAILKGLSLLDYSGGLVDLAEDSCRTNIITLLTAISQHNPYPAQYFSEGIFNQMVLKSLFLDINIEAIIGLQKRINEPMSSMCFDYARERIAASRRVPASIWLTINLALLPQAIALFKHYIGDKNKQHRYYIALSLSWQKPCTLLADEISQRKTNETETDVLAMLNAISQ